MTSLTYPHSSDKPGEPVGRVVVDVDHSRRPEGVASQDLQRVVHHSWPAHAAAEEGPRDPLHGE